MQTNGHQSPIAHWPHVLSKDVIYKTLETTADELWRIAAAVGDKEEPKTAEWDRSVNILAKQLGDIDALIVALCHQLDEWEQHGWAEFQQEQADEMRRAAQEDQLLADHVSWMQGRPQTP